jgi:hypothetical protein|eukprot:COSAG06_NODE_1259_length_10075_cov_50.687049_2_plen_82_part_00
MQFANCPAWVPGQHHAGSASPTSHRRTISGSIIAVAVFVIALLALCAKIQHGRRSTMRDRDAAGKADPLLSGQRDVTTRFV